MHSHAVSETCCKHASRTQLNASVMLAAICLNMMSVGRLISACEVRTKGVCRWAGDDFAKRTSHVWFAWLPLQGRIPGQWREKHGQVLAIGRQSRSTQRRLIRSYLSWDSEPWSAVPLSCVCDLLLSASLCFVDGQSWRACVEQRIHVELTQCRSLNVGVMGRWLVVSPYRLCPSEPCRYLHWRGGRRSIAQSGGLALGVVVSKVSASVGALSSGG